MQQPPRNPPPDVESLWRVEATRYALLRRLAHSMRHHMVIHLQPIGMITEVLDRRLKASTTNFVHVQESMVRINGFSKAAVQSCLDVVSWLAPDATTPISVAAGVGECLSLLRSNLSFRGFTVREELQDGATPVLCCALRSVLPAALLTLTDRAKAPATLVVQAQSSPGAATVSLTVTPDQGAPGFAGEPPYRILDWDEVQALADAESVGMRREGDTVHLAFSAVR